MPDIPWPQEINQSNGQASVPTAMAVEIHAANDITRQSAEAVMQRSRAAGEALRQGATATAEVTRQGTPTTVEAVCRTVHEVAEGHRQVADVATQTFQEVSSKVVQTTPGTSEEVRRLATLPQAAEGGLRGLQRSMAGLIEGVVQANLHIPQKLFRFFNPMPVVELQQRFARKYWTP